MPCCDHTNNVQCQSRCREVLRTFTVEEHIVDELISACGHPDLVVNNNIIHRFLKTFGKIVKMYTSP